MRLAVVVAFVAMVLLSVYISLHFHITFVAILTGLLVSLKQFKVAWVFEWLFRFLLFRLPQRILTALVKLYIIDRETMHTVLGAIKRYQLYLQTHHKTKVIIFGALTLILMGVSAWWIGLWLLVIYEVETLILMVWRRIWPSLSEMAFVEGIGRAFGFVANTRLGRLWKRADAWLEEKLRRNAEVMGKQHKEYIVDTIEETLQYVAKGTYLPPLPQETDRFDLRQPPHQKRANRQDQKPDGKGMFPPPPRPKR